MDALRRIVDSTDDNFDEHLEAIRRLVQQPSVSATGHGMEEILDLVTDEIRKLGGDTEVVETDGYPVVYGELGNDSPKTLLLYGMYDVQPVDDEEGQWKVPPFAAETAETKFGDAVVSRGVYNSKGPLQAFFNVVREMQRLDELPVNLLFAIEGEEELGSPHLPQFVEEKTESLKDADAAFFPIPSQGVEGRPNVLLGVKGIVYWELTVEGGDWGGPTEFGIHSSFASTVDSPTWELIRLLSELVDEDGRVTIPGFYDDARPPTEEELEMARELADAGVPKEWEGVLEVSRFKADGNVEAVEDYLFEPDLNVDGIVSGFTGEGTKTLLPHSAKAKLDFRLVSDMTPDKVIGQLRSHVEDLGYGDIAQIEVLDQYPWAGVDRDSEVVEAFTAGLRDLGYDPLIWPRLAASAPFYLFNDPPLNLDFVTGGPGRAGRAHSPNEFFTIDGIRSFEESVAAFLLRYGAQ